MQYVKHINMARQGRYINAPGAKAKLQGASKCFVLYHKVN